MKGVGLGSGTITFTENSEFVIFNDLKGIYIFNMTDFQNIRVVGENDNSLFKKSNYLRAYNSLSNYN